MLTRRRLLSMLAALPFLGSLIPKITPSGVGSIVLFDHQKELLSELNLEPIVGIKTGDCSDVEFIFIGQYDGYVERFGDA